MKGSTISKQCCPGMLAKNDKCKCRVNQPITLLRRYVYCPVSGTVFDMDADMSSCNHRSLFFSPGENMRRFRQLSNSKGSSKELPGFYLSMWATNDTSNGTMASSNMDTLEEYPRCPYCEDDGNKEGEKKRVLSLHQILKNFQLDLYQTVFDGKMISPELTEFLKTKGEYECVEDWIGYREEPTVEMRKAENLYDCKPIAVPTKVDRRMSIIAPGVILRQTRLTASMRRFYARTPRILCMLSSERQLMIGALASRN